LEAVADRAIERKTGARGLHAIMEDVLGDLMYESPSDHTIKKITITKNCVTEEEKQVCEFDPARRPQRLQITAARRPVRPRRDSAS